jgi:hypothetical protein
MTPYWSGFHIDAIPHSKMSPEECAPFTAKMQSWLGKLNWLQMFTCLDLAVFSVVKYTFYDNPNCF